jgi:hypothetical protein
MSESQRPLVPPFFVTPEEEMKLRIRANQLVPSPAIAPAASFDDFVRQLMIPTIVMELARKASGIHFSAWETEAIRASLHNGILQKILVEKGEKDDSRPPISASRVPEKATMIICCRTLVRHRTRMNTWATSALRSCSRFGRVRITRQSTPTARPPGSFTA